MYTNVDRCRNIQTVRNEMKPFRAISHVKVELISNVSATVTVSFISGSYNELSVQTLDLHLSFLYAVTGPKGNSLNTNIHCTVQSKRSRKILEKIKWTCEVETGVMAYALYHEMKEYKTKKILGYSEKKAWGRLDK